MILGLARAALTFALVTTSATARPPQPADVGIWSIYGSTGGFARDDQVSGRGALTVKAPAVSGEEWAVGASMPIPDALPHGQSFNAIFWARAAHPIRTTVTLQAAAPDYPIFATTTVDLTPQWRQYVVSGVPQKDLAAGSQLLAVRLGKASADVTLGPVLFQPGAIDQKQVRAAFARFRPAEIVQDVRIPSGPGVVLAGRLRLPGLHGKGPFPVVLLLAGSGRSGRGVFPLLEQRLLADGIATFDYDKRGVGESTGVLEDTLEQVERDAANVVTWLRARPELLPHRVAVLGLSQGGVVSPALASADPDIAAVVMLAGIVAPRQTLVFDQMAHQLSVAGIARDKADHMVAATRTLLEAKDTNQPDSVVASSRQALAQAVTSGGLSADDVKAAVANLDSPVTLSAYRLDLVGTLAKIRAPVLALYAEKDDLVPTATSLPFAKAALRANPDATVIEIPNTNHGFQLPGSDPAGKPQWTGAVASAPGVADLICRWLEVRLHAHTRK